MMQVGVDDFAPMFWNVPLRDPDGLLRFIERLTDLTVQLQQCSGLNHCLDYTAETARAMLQADRAVIIQLQLAGRAVVVAESIEGRYPPLLGTIVAASSVSAWVKQFQQNGYEVIVEPSSNPMLSKYSEEVLRQTQATLVIPILIPPGHSLSKLEPHLWGILVVQHGQSLHQWPAFAVKLLHYLAVQLAIAIRHNTLAHPPQHTSFDSPAHQDRYSPTVQADDHLQSNEARFRTIYEHAGCGIAIVTLPDIKLRQTNQALQTLVGYSADELSSLDYTDITYPDDLPLETILLQECVEGKRNFYTLEKRFICKDGQIRWASLAVSIIRDSCGAIQFAVEVVEDITERKRIEDALRQQTDRVRLMASITQNIRQSLNLERILTTTVTEVRHFLEADRVVIYRFESDWSGRIVTESVAPGWPSILGIQLDDKCFGEHQGKLYQQGKINATEDIYTQNFPACYVDLLSQLQVRAKLVVPILQGDDLWGLLIAHHFQTPRQWQPTEIELLQQIAAQVGIAIQQSELYQRLQVANQELHRLATVDTLTQVANRRYFDSYLNQEWHRLSRERSPLALILGDVDCFKLYNDTYGHLAGDYCLTTVAQAIHRHIKRPADLVARYGGEEFGIILPNTTAAGAIKIVQSIRQEMQHLHLPHEASPVQPYVTLSFGISSEVPCAQCLPQDLLERADQALYRVKRANRDDYCIL